MKTRSTISWNASFTSDHIQPMKIRSFDVHELRKAVEGFEENIFSLQGYWQKLHGILTETE